MDLSDCTDLLETYRRQFHVTQEQFARLTGISDQSFSQWGQGASPSPKERKAFVESDRLLHGLARVMEGIQIGSWLAQRNPAFDGSTPLEVIERGELDRIWRMIYDLDSGQPS
jgi:transcriptional regulator with XRE-family HTH domain